MAESPTDFIRQIVAEDLAAGKHETIATRFPPEPNGYLHIGHAKSICLNFGIAAENEGSTCNLRFDDTNPSTEDTEYVESIKDAIRWLGFDWGDREYYASDYFEQLYQWAEKLITDGKAYVCSLTAQEISDQRGSWHDEGQLSPYRDRSVEENLELFRKMRAGEFADGEHVLRAKIDMSASNPNLRDPVMYRIRHERHHRTGDDWCIYPNYDWAHGQSDAIEGITHSLCSLEFEVHRPLYDWFTEALELDDPPHQTEFARLDISYTVLSKRKLLRLVKEGKLSGWDDPRMPTLVGLRRRGYTPVAIREFCDRIGVAKANSQVDIKLLDYCLRQDLEERSPRRMAVLNPLKVVIENYPEDQVDELHFPDHPDHPERGERIVPFCRELYIERDDFMEEPVRKFFRLAPGREVRLRWAYLITCTDVIKDPETGEIVELRCTYDPETRGGNAPDGRRVKGTLHWVSARHALDAEVRVYDHLFTAENPNDAPEGKDFTDLLNPDSLHVLGNAKLEPSLAEPDGSLPYQFERKGYFVVDSEDSAPGALVFNRTVGLRDAWARKLKQQPGGGKNKPGRKGKKNKQNQQNRQNQQRRQP
jgi:glutaminyl-tRNA synthetase